MYSKIYSVWQEEYNQLQKGEKRSIILPESFFRDASCYLNSLENGIKTSNVKSLNLKLKRKEFENLNLIIHDLATQRMRKIVILALSTTKSVDTSNFSDEEKAIFSMLQKFKVSIFPVEGIQELKASEAPSRNVVLRFLQHVPALVGADMKIYGPFKAEDVASIPLKNVESLISRGVVRRVDLS